MNNQEKGDPLFTKMKEIYDKLTKYADIEQYSATDKMKLYEVAKSDLGLSKTKTEC